MNRTKERRKELAGIKKLANERAKKANLHNKKLRDCRYHFNDEPTGKEKDAIIEKQKESTIFITEGDSASGSITKARNVETQAVFSLRGKPLNCFGLTKKVVYENEEFNLLQHALNIEEAYEGLRYNNIVIATDADVDGMHIRLLLMTFFPAVLSRPGQRTITYIFWKRHCSGCATNRKRSIVMMKVKNRRPLRNLAASPRSRDLKDWVRFLRMNSPALLVQICGCSR